MPRRSSGSKSRSRTAIFRSARRRTASGGFGIATIGGVTVYVTAPGLSAAAIGGSGDMRIDRVEGGNFEASIGGSGDMEIGALRADEASFSVAGSGDIRAAGTAERRDVSIAGSGDVDHRRAANARRLGLDRRLGRRPGAPATGTADVSIMGSGDVDDQRHGQMQRQQDGLGRRARAADGAVI